jgi:excinuclease ABC subunit B
MTDSMKAAIGETDRRRALQHQYNEANGITPQSISKPVDMSLARIVEADYVQVPDEPGADEIPASAGEMKELLDKWDQQMRQAAKAFEFEKAAKIRDRIKALKTRDLMGVMEAGG